VGGEPLGEGFPPFGRREGSPPTRGGHAGGALQEPGVRSRLVARLLPDVTEVQAGNGLLDYAEWDRQKGGYFCRDSARVRG